ncbi:Calcium-transporting ATPase PAT1 [Diplonema papillatum]|nr:Calcium-transporting ATPase PAT1 [Diplonema papillatum]
MSLSLEPDQLREMVGLKDDAALSEFGGVAGVLKHLGGVHDTGEDLQVRRMRYGENVLPPPERQTFLDFVKEALSDRTMVILVCAALLSLILGLTTPDPRTGKVDYKTGWIEGAAILVSVAIVVVVTAVNDFQKQKKFAELEHLAHTVKNVTVTRGRQAHSIPSSEVVVGDQLHLQQGEQIDADCLLLGSLTDTRVVFDESDVTGETEEVIKSPLHDPFLISGTSLVEGSCSALVVAVGATSFRGHIAMATRAAKKPTPLQEKLEGLADTIGKFGLAAAAATFLVLAARETFLLWQEATSFSFMKYWEMLTTAVAIVVVAVPEGLPLSVTISLAYSMKQMLTDKNLVRHLAACETMGGATCICSDKTGTLTKSEMTAVRFWVAGSSFDLRTNQKPHETDPRILQPTVEACEAIFYSSVDESNKTAQALLAMADTFDVVPPEFPAKRNVLDPEFTSRNQFTSSTKQSSTRVFNPRTNSTTIYAKGASEILLEQCTAWRKPDGERAELTPDVRKVIESALFGYAKEGYRTICLASAVVSGNVLHKPLPGIGGGEGDAHGVGLTCLGIVGIEEPIREEVEGAIALCRQAGIDVKMVTGDNLVSAVTVATRCGIVMEGCDRISMDAKLFRQMSFEDRAAMVPQLAVLARATPLDKQLLIEALKNDPLQVVAVTGDGTNDGPALKCADVGFAMNSGTEVAKAASDIILTDDNFVGVSKAVMWGRNVNDNIRKFIQFQLTVNAAACLIAIIGACLSDTNLSPLKPVQLLWLNLIMDSFAALGLATEMPGKQLLHRDPLPKNAPIISRAMWGFIIGQGMYQLHICVYLLTYGHEWMDVAYFGQEHLTIVFNTFVLMQVTNLFNARVLGLELNVFKDIQRSYVLVIIAAFIAGCQVDPSSNFWWGARRFWEQRLRVRRLSETDTTRASTGAPPPAPRFFG